MPRHAPPHIRRWQVTFIVTVFVLAVAGAAVGGWWYARESSPHPGPIVLISADGLTPAQFSTPHITSTASVTPALDALAADAIVFDRAYSHSPLTLPAHASLLSGQLPFEHGVRDEAGFALSEKSRPLAQLLRNRGFETGAAVSSFLLRPDTGLARGFSYFDAALPEPADGDELALDRDGAQTAEAATEWLRSRSGYRFLLFVQVDASAAEETVAALVAELKDRNLYNQATIFVTSDHASDTDGLSITEEALHVPLIVKQPNREGAGRHVEVTVQQIDLVPTILDLVRAPMPSGLGGRSLRALLIDEKGRIPEQTIYAETLAARFRFGGFGHAALLSPEFRELEPGEIHLPTEPTEIAAEDVDRFAVVGNLGIPGLDGAALAPLSDADSASIAKTHREASALVAHHQYAAAIAKLRQITRAHPDIALIDYQLGNLLGEVGRFDQAEAAFRAAARLEPDSPYIPLAEARMFLKAERLEAARDRAALALALSEIRNAPAVSAAQDVISQVAAALDARQSLQDQSLSRTSF